MRKIELEKEKILHEIEKEIEEKFSSYEDLLKRKRDEEKEVEAQKKKIKMLMEEHKKHLKNMRGQFGPEERELMKKAFEEDFRTLSGAIERERNR